MKFKLSVIFIVFIFVTLVIAGAYVYDFTVTRYNGDIKITWKTQIEENVEYFALQRKTNETNEWVTIYTTKPHGSNSTYYYLDTEIYKINDTQFMYRLAIAERNSDGTTTISYLDGPAPITQNISGVKRTWGSIKAMFR